MDYKEKYEMALEGIQEILGSGEDSIKMSRLQLRLQGIFPELKKNKDEDILKGLISMCKTLGKTKWVAWLEKQGKKELVTCPICGSKIEKQGEQKSTEWSETDKLKMETIIHVISNQRGSAIFEGLLPEELINWLNDIKDRVQPQSKQEWCKEAENNILFLTSIIEECFKDKEEITLCGDTVCANFTKENVIDRLKSLSPQSTWKPSDEQLNSLYDVLNPCDGLNRDVLESLYNDLKKLRED